MEIFFGYVLYLLPLLIIFYVLYSLSLIKSKLDLIINYFDIKEYPEETVTNEQIEQELEEQMKNH